MKGKDMYSQTIAVLEKYDNDREFERMCGRIVVAQGYKDVVLVAPRGGSDGGKDISFTTESGGKGLACVTLRKDIEVKFKQDFYQRTAGEYDKYILFCTAHLTAKQKLDFISFCMSTLQAEFIPTDIEALRSILDSALTHIRDRCLYVGDQEKQRRSVLLGKFRRLWILSNDGITPGMIAGTEPLPKAW